MSAKVILTITEGPMRGERFVFKEHDTLLFGRAKDCHVCLPHDDYLNHAPRSRTEAAEAGANAKTIWAEA
jgi:hypothetical protein